MNNSQREKLIEYLDTHCIDGYGELQTWQVADFIIKDRERIVQPIIRWKKRTIRLFGVMGWDEKDAPSKAMDETLTLALGKEI